MAANLALTLPVPALAVIALESDVSANPSGSVGLTLPVPKISFSAGAGNAADMSGLTLPMPGIALVGSTPVAAKMGMVLPVPKVSMTGVSAGVAALALTLPAPVLSLAGPNSQAMVLPAPTLQLIGRTGIVGALSLVMPRATLALEGTVPFTGKMALNLPVPQIALAGSAGNAARMAMQLTRLALALEGHTGVVGEMALTLPVGRLDLEGHGPFSADLTLTLPMLLLQQVGRTTGVTPLNPDGIAQPAIVMHSETGALTQYTNFPFNSFAAFNGMYLAASAEGLFMLGGATDNGALINAAARVGMTDFGTSFLKRVDRSYVGYRTDGNLVIRVYTDEVDSRDYMLEATGRLGLHGNHFRIGKGLRARYWQFEVQNQNGADFTLNSIELKPTQLRRRIGGGDA